jgi:hypothetical protein
MTSGVIPAAQACAERECDSTPRAAADRHETHRAALARRDPGDRRVEAVDVVANRPRRERVRAYARKVEPAYGRADVEARDVVAERQMPVDVDPARDRIDRGRGRDDDVRAGASASRAASI